jgi:hypothetical protein
MSIKDGEVKNALFWAYNLPLQVWPTREDGEDDGESRPVTGSRLLNYMARKERCCEIELSECLGDQTREEFFESAALVLENLARLMREAGKNPALRIYYPDAGMDEIRAREAGQ